MPDYQLHHGQLIPHTMPEGDVGLVDTYQSTVAAVTQGTWTKGEWYLRLLISYRGTVLDLDAKADDSQATLDRRSD
jgi:hypothetical protein